MTVRSVAGADLARKAMAELFGTGLLVFFGAGIVTVSFGFRAFGSSIVAGIGVTGAVFALVLIAIIVLIEPISGCHVNPAVTLGALLARRIRVTDAVVYWAAQLTGGILGALLLLWVVSTSPYYSEARIGLGANNWGTVSLLHASAGGAFLSEVILTAVFVMVVLTVTRANASLALAAAAAGLTLGLGNIAGLPVDFASLNPARSLGPAVVLGGTALSHVWLFLVAPLVGALFAVAGYMLLYPEARGSAPGLLPGALALRLSSRVRSQPGVGQASACPPRGVLSVAGRAAP